MDARLEWLFNRDKIHIRNASVLRVTEGVVNKGTIVADSGLTIETPHDLNFGNIRTVGDLCLHLQKAYELGILLSGGAVNTEKVLYVDVDDSVDIPTTSVPFLFNLESRDNINFKNLILQEGGTLKGKSIDGEGGKVTSTGDFTLIARRNINRKKAEATVGGKFTQVAGKNIDAGAKDETIQYQARAEGKYSTTGSVKAASDPNSDLIPKINVEAGEIEARATIEHRGDWNHEYDVLTARPIFDSQGNLTLIARRKFLMEAPKLSGNGEITYGSLTGDASLLAVTLENIRRWQEVHKKRTWYGRSKKTVTTHERRDQRVERAETLNKGNVVELAPHGTLHQQAPRKDIVGNLTIDAKNVNIEAAVTHHSRKTESRTKSSGVAGLGAKSSTHRSHKEWEDIVPPEFNVTGNIHTKAQKASFESVVGQVAGDFFDETEELLFLAKMISRHEEEHNTFKKFSAKGGYGYTLDVSQEVPGNLRVRNFIDALGYNYFRDQEGNAYREEDISPDSADGEDTNVCGFNALNVEREAVVVELIAKIREEDREGGDLYHTLMASEVADTAEGAIRRVENPAFNRAYQSDEEYQTLRGRYQSVRDGDHEIRDQIIEEIHAWAKKTSTLQTYLRNYVGQRGVMLEYLEQPEGMEDRTGVMDAIAHLRGYNLRVYRRSEETGRLIEVHHYRGGDQEINLHHMAYDPENPNILNHYNRLFSVNMLQEDTQSRRKVKTVGNSIHVLGDSEVDFESREPTSSFSYTPYAWSKSRNQELCAAIAIAMTVAGNYVGAKLFATLGATGAAMGGAALGTTFSTSANAILNGESVGRTLGSSDFLRSLATSTASAGLTSRLSEALGVAQTPTTFLEHTAKAALRAGVNMVTQTTIGGQPARDAIKGALTGMATDIIGGMGANAIGEGYFIGQLDAITHKLAHALLGGATGALMSLDDPAKGAAAGALGAAVAETVLDIIASGPSLADIIEEAGEKRLNEQEFHKLYQARLDEIQSLREDNVKWGKMASVTAALLLGQDVNIAYQTGSNAVENNWLMLVYYGAIAASIGYSAYQIYDVYEKEGPEAALRQLGIEVLTNVAGGVTGRVVGKAGCYIGRQCYPTVRAAVAAVLDKNPTLKFALGRFTDKLVAAGEKLLSSEAGQGVTRAAERLNASKFGHAAQKLEQKLVDAEQKVADKVKGVFGSKPNAASGSGLTQAERMGHYPQSTKQAQLLHNQLRAEQIAKGHAYDKHKLSQGEFPDFRTTKQLGYHVENILNKPKEAYIIGPGRTAYVDRPSHTVVIVDPAAPSGHGGTVFQPRESMNAFLKQRGWKK